ncbi:uncharacterized protein LOC132027298 [Mustela nigripes]|uniref:uncharacterized protein LOC132027298 n=1 Tax=Mustela nigripes TaxID=77151 RepID=UPI002814EEA6|nr:uncharacterized protein LOC132027298 [Mustela nigripes]
MAPARLLEPPRPLALNCNGRRRWGFRGGGDGTQRRGLGGGTFLPSRKMDEPRLPVPLFAGAARRPVIGPQSRKRRARPAAGILTVEGAPWSPGSAETLVACGAQRRAVDGLRLCLPTAGSGLGPLPLREPRRPSPDPGDGRGGDQEHKGFVGLAGRATPPELGPENKGPSRTLRPPPRVSDEKGGALLSQSGTFLGNLSKLE